MKDAVQAEERLLAGVRGLTFDLDGTLANVGLRRLGLWREFMRHPRVLSAWPAAVASLRGQRWADSERTLQAAIAREVGLPPEQVAAILRPALYDRWPRLFAGAGPPAGVRRLIEAADARGLPRAVVSDHGGLEKLEHMDSRGWTVVVSAMALGALKPLPDALAAAAASMGVAPRDLLHVGDRWDTDGLAAAAVGCRFVHVEQLR